MVSEKDFRFLLQNISGLVILLVVLIGLYFLAQQWIARFDEHIGSVDKSTMAIAMSVDKQRQSLEALAHTLGQIVLELQELNDLHVEGNLVLRETLQVELKDSEVIQLIRRQERRDAVRKRIEEQDVAQ